jgi:hypothetical protein
VTITNPGSSAATLPGGFFADYVDVPQAHPFHGQILSVTRRGITAGCGGGGYCPSAPVTRAQMAVFLLKAEHGSSYTPPACGGVYADLACPSLFADWVERLAAENVTAGCGGGNYCPDAAVTRAQMAVFLLKIEHGSGYAPPACTGDFADVACPSLFADWIEQLAAEGVTAGCGGGLYCPDAAVTRRQMAVFLLKTKEGSGYAPPPATGVFDDVPAGDPFAPWIEELYNRSITGGCQAVPLLYCPDQPNTRGQMAVFLTKTFGLQ